MVGVAPKRNPTKRLRRQIVVGPPWLMLPLLWLGALYLVVTPLEDDWYRYGVALAFAVLIGVWSARRYRVTVLYRAERGVIVWIRWEKHRPDQELETPLAISPPPDAMGLDMDVE